MAARHVNPNQLAMFMTPREIMGTYQALDADRQENEDDRYGDVTKRPFTTYGAHNRQVAGSGTDASYQKPAWLQNPGSGSAGPSGGGSVGSARYTRAYSPAPETDEELWSRKREEAQLPAADYAEVHQPVRSHPGGSSSHTPGYETLMDRSSAPMMGSNPGTAEFDRMDSYMDRKQNEWHERRWDAGSSLYDKIAQQGVLSPVHLGRQQGTMGKPQVVGGHHRLASAMDLAPDQPIPVLHHHSIADAKTPAPGTYHYT